MTDSMQLCIDNHVSLDDVGIYMVNDDFCVPVNSAQLRFSDIVKDAGILILDNQE